MSKNLIFSSHHASTLSDITELQDSHENLDPLGLPQKNRYALCVSGTVRGLGDQDVYESMINKLLLPFGKSLDNWDIFMYLDLHSELNYWSVDQLGRALQALKPVRVNFQYEDTKFPGNTCPTGLPGTITARNLYVMFRKVQECYKLVLDYEKLHGFQYQYVIRSRPDMYWVTEVPVTSETVSSTKVTMKKYPDGRGYSDHFAIVPRHLAHAYFNVADFIDDCTTHEEMSKICGMEISLSVGRGDWPPECWLQKYMADQDLKVDMHRMYWYFYRPDGTLVLHSTAVGLNGDDSAIYQGNITCHKHEGFAAGCGIQELLMGRKI